MGKIKGTLDRRSFTAAIAAGTVSGLAALPAPSVWAQSARQVTFLLDIGAYGKHALFYPGLEKGFFKDAGLDVRFEAAKGSADNVVKVAAGSAQFGFCDTPTSILARAAGAKVKQVLMVHYKAMSNVVSLASNPVRTPHDMVGKTFGATAGDAPRVALPALAKINHFDASKVEIVTIEGSAKPAVLASKRVNGILGLSAFAPVYAEVIEKTGDKIVQFEFSDFGLDIYSNGIIVTDDLAAKDPKLVSTFNEAMVKSIIFAVRHPDEATAAFLKHNPLANPKSSRAQLDVAIDHLMVDEVKKNGIGPMSAKKMEFTLDIVREFFGLKGPVKLEEIYSNDYVKPGQLPA